MRPARILVVEDDARLRELLLDELEDAGYERRAAATAEQAREALAERAFDLVVCDLRLPGVSGLELLRHARALEVPPAFIMITAFGTVAQAVECLKEGADDFLTKPLDLDHLVLTVSRVLERRRLAREVHQLRQALGPGDFHGMIGRSEGMRRLFAQIRRVAPGGGPVLIEGESGTGKELVARALHAESDRGDGPFLAVNCAGIPTELLESEFFGHARGAFTGATTDRKGLFAEADGGTLLLDEITEMPTGLQAKLLRVLQEGTIRRVGDPRERSVDVRVLASTNRDPEEEVSAGRLREDLFFRLETFRLPVPPLRDRGDDLELLAAHFCQRTAARLNRRVRGLDARTLRRLRRYPFPGNVRELENAMERAVTFCDGELLRPEHLPGRIREAVAVGGAPEDVATPPLAAGVAAPVEELPPLAAVERRYIRHVLRRVEGNKRRAARILGIARRTLYRKLEEGDEAGDGDQP